MIQTEKSRLQAKQVIYLIAVHTGIYTLYNYAHGMINLLYVLSEYIPILLIFCLAPLVAALLLFTQSARQGAILVLGIMLAELIYTIYTRFGVAGPFTIQEPALFWKIVYEGSFGMTLALEVIISWMTFRFLQELHKQGNSLSGNPS